MPANVLVLVLDTARADAFEPYGAGRNHPPRWPRWHPGHRPRHVLDRVLDPSVPRLDVHRHPPARARPRPGPRGHPRGARPVLEAQANRLLPEVLRRTGWETRAVSTNLWVSPPAASRPGSRSSSTSAREPGRSALGTREDLRGRLRCWAYDGLRANMDDGAGEAESTIHRLARRAARSSVLLVREPGRVPLPVSTAEALQRPRARRPGAGRRRGPAVSLSEAIWRSCLGDLGSPRRRSNGCATCTPVPCA